MSFSFRIQKESQISVSASVSVPRYSYANDSLKHGDTESTSHRWFFNTVLEVKAPGCVSSKNNQSIFIMTSNNVYYICDDLTFTSDRRRFTFMIKKWYKYYFDWKEGDNAKNNVE